MGFISTLAPRNRLRNFAEVVAFDVAKCYGSDHGTNYDGRPKSKRAPSSRILGAVVASVYILSQVPTLRELHKTTYGRRAVLTSRDITSCTLLSSVHMAVVGNCLRRASVAKSPSYAA